MAILKMFLIVQLGLFSSPAMAASRPQVVQPSSFRFTATELTRLKATQDSHGLAKSILARAGVDPILAKQMQVLLKKAAFPLPAFELKNGAIRFTFEGQTYKWSRLEGQKYLINGKQFDFSSPEWKSQFQNTSAFHPYFSLWIDEAQALAPLAWGLIWAGSLIVAGCLISNLPPVAGGLGSAPIDYGKTVSVAKEKFNRSIRVLRQAFKAMGCAAHADESFGDDPDYYSFFADYCTSLNSAVAASDSQIRQIINPYRRPITPEERTELFIEQVKGRYLDRAKLCSVSCEAYSSPQFPDVDKQIIDQVMATPEFKQSCRAGHFAISGTTDPAQGDSATGGVEIDR